MAVVVVCRVYYEKDEERERRRDGDVAVLRSLQGPEVVIFSLKLNETG